MNINELHAMADGQPVIYLLDAANSFEESLLRDWLQAGRSLEEPNAQPFTVPIRRGGNSPRLQQALTGPEETLIAPVRVVWQPPDVVHRAPRLRDLLLGDRHRPGRLRGELIKRRHPDRVAYVVGQPATIARLRHLFDETGRRSTHDESQGFAAFVERQASLVLDIAERGLQGGRYKVPKFVAENLQRSSRFNDAIDALSAATGTPRQELVNEARAYMREMIARPETFWIDVMGAITRFICSQGYEADIVYDQDSLERIRQIVRDNPSILLWTHKSYVDGFAITGLCFDNDFPAPHILGGVNMAFAGLGFLGRRTPAIFIRRTFKDNPLYKLVLRHYLGYLMEKRFPLSWAFEGTRSRVGKLMPPRYGLLKYTLDAARETDARNIHILPVSISYDLITDVADYAAEQTGKKKKPESLGWFLTYINRLRSPMGRVYVNFGEPVVLDKAPPEDDSMALSRIAFRVALNANAVTPITLPSLGCMVLLGATPQALTTRELRREVTALIEWAQRRSIRLTSDFDLANIEHRRAITRIMIDSGLVTRYAEGPQPVYAISADHQLQASYYRNTVIHYFINKAIAELALAKAAEVESGPASEVFWTEVDRIRDLMKFEFFYAPLAQFREEIERELVDVQPEWESALANGGAAANQMLAAMHPFVAHSTLLHFVEAYSLVADLLAGHPSSEAFDEKNCVTRATRYGQQLILQRRILSQASISELLFRNAYRLMENQGLTGSRDKSLAARRNALALELRDLRQRLRRIRAMAVTARGQKLQSTGYGTAPVARASGE
jgi:glycerol-3-phosphate O-acyltransferase